MVGVLVLLLALAWTVSAWFLVGVPFAVAGCCAMWAGLSNEEALEAFGAGDDVGRGPRRDVSVAHVRDLLGVVATVAVLGGLVLMAVLVRHVAGSVGVQPPFSGALAGAAFGMSLYVVAKAAVNRPR